MKVGYAKYKMKLCNLKAWKVYVTKIMLTFKGTANITMNVQYEITPFNVVENYDGLVSSFFFNTIWVSRMIMIPHFLILRGHEYFTIFVFLIPSRLHTMQEPTYSSKIP